MITAILYNEMVERGLTSSMRSWSEEWAGRAHNFASTHWSKKLPAETLVRIRRRLIELGHPDIAAVVLLALLDELPSGDRIQGVWYAP